LEPKKELPEDILPNIKKTQILSRRIKKLGDRVWGKKYEIFREILDEFDGVDSCPDVVYLGDSTVFSISDKDEDRRSTSDMLAADLFGKARVLGLTHGAYHMEIYYHILNVFGRTRKRPRLVIVPINMRSFSPQWYMRPSWRFETEIELLNDYSSGIGRSIYYRKRECENGYEKINVTFPMCDLQTIGEFERVRLSKPESMTQQEIRRKVLFIYFYLYSIAEKHPRLLRLIEMLNLTRKTAWYRDNVLYKPD